MGSYKVLAGQVGEYHTSQQLPLPAGSRRPGLTPWCSLFKTLHLTLSIEHTQSMPELAVMDVQGVQVAIQTLTYEHFP